jgi:deazaflavin-dependent oxidoreductase (nitroreductase family)
VIEELRSNQGVVGGMFEGTPLLLITVTGAKSGTKRTLPLAYTKDGDRVVIIASKGGAPTNPDWYHNLVANPDVTVEIGDDKWEARASVTEGEERDRLFDAQAKVMPGFAEYQANTTRKIPVVVLERVN